MAEDPEIPSSGAVFTFGKSKFAENAPSKFWIKRDEVILISCGDEHTAVVTETGRLFTFGSNEWGQLGLGHNNNVVKPSCVKVLKPDAVVAVCCGKNHTVVATATGAVWAVGANGEGQLGCGRNPEWTSVPIQVHGIDGVVAQLSAGTQHSAALTEDGSVWVWGSNTEGQLGLGEESEENVYSPVRLPIDKKIVDISLGYYHTAIVTSEGELFTFGEGDGGKLGLDNAKDGVDTPTMVVTPEKIAKVSCGGSHTLALTVTGKLYSFGLSTNGQLGLGTRILESSTPHPITTLAHLTLTDVSCGENHSAVLTNSGQLYTFGDGRHGKLCLDVETITNHFSPAFVTRFKAFQVTKAICGGCHTMVLGVPIADYQEEEEELNEIKVNGSINEEINVEARERRRYGLRDENKLPPIKSKPKDVSEADELLTSNAEEENSDEEMKENGLADGHGDESDELDENGTSEAEDTDSRDEVEDMETKGEKEDEKTEGNENENENENDETKEEKKGVLSKFFSGLRKKKNSSEESVEDVKDKVKDVAEEAHELGNALNDSAEDVINNESHDSEESPKKDKIKSPSKIIEEDEKPKEKKKVSFFRQFSRENKDKEDKSNENDKKPQQNNKEIIEEEDETDEEESEEESESEDEDTLTSPVKVLKDDSSKNAKSTSNAKLLSPSKTGSNSNTPSPSKNGKVKSKTCLIL